MRRRWGWGWTHTYAVPMFVTSLVAVVLAGSALAAVLVFERGSAGGDGIRGLDETAGPATPGPATPGPATPGPDVTGTATGGEPAECLPGRWLMVSEVREVENATQELTGGTPVSEFLADGTGSLDYGNGAVFEGAALLVVAYTAEATGDLGFRYEVADDGLRYEITSNNTQVAVDTIVDVDPPETVGFPQGPYDIDCDADTLTLRYVDDEIDYTAEYQRA